MNKTYDVIIVGGSYAGLSAGLSLGRSLKKVLIIDSGLPCNRQTPHSQNFLTQDGETPAAIAHKARKQVEKYSTVEFYQGLAIEGKAQANGFEILMESGVRFIGNKLIFATGIRDIMPDIAGFAACWGISVIHCPYCHGYEYRDKKVGIFIQDERAFHLAQLVNNLTGKLSMLTNGKPIFNEEQKDKLAKHNIAIIENKVQEIEHRDGYIKQLVFQDSKKIPFDAIYSSVPFEQHCSIPKTLGCEIDEQGYIVVDNLKKTNVKGVFAVGDCAGPMRSVSNAVASGSFAGSMANMELTQERF